MSDFKDLAEYKQYWTLKLSNGDFLNHSTAELMLRAVEGAKSLEEAEQKIQEAIEVANFVVLSVWDAELRRLRY